MMKINEKITIPDQYLRFRYVRSSGPGGQNVNKLSTQAQLTFDLKNCTQIPPYAKQRLIQLAGRRTTGLGEIIISSERFRKQILNREDCLNRLRQLVLQALTVPKKRRRTRPTLASKHRRLAGKAHRSKVKKLRGNVSMDQ